MTSAAKPVFISYSTATGGAAARALETALGSDLVYRDETNLMHGSPFPAQLFEALIGARVIVCLLDEAYWTSWFCRAEFDLAIADEDTTGVVLALPGGSKDPGIQNLLPALRAIQWPRWEESDAIGTLVHDRLTDGQVRPLQDRLAPDELAARRGWLNEDALMPPRRAVPMDRLAVNLPSMPEGRFAGRATELAAIHTRLLPPQGPGTCAVVAPGGGGKTRLAEEYLWRYGATHYPGGVVWLSAAAPESRDQQLYEILAQLIPDLPPLAALLQMKLDLAKRLREKLDERASGGPMLWIIDNLPEPAPGEPPIAIDTWAPVGIAPVAVLVTSRLRQQPAAINLDVDALDRDASILLLGRDLPSGLLTADEADQIAAAVGDWPLALELLNASFVAQALTPAEFLEHHGRDGVAQVLDDTMEVLRPQVPIGALRGISESLLLSYERLGPPAQLLARALAHYAAATPIPLVLVEALPEETWNPRARTTLVSHTLLTHPARDTIGQLHPLVADFLRAQDSDGAGLAAAGTALRTIIDAHDPAEPPHWPAINLVMPHAQALWARGELPPDQEVHLGAWVATSLQEQGRYTAAIDQWEPVIDTARRVRGRERAETLAYERCHGDALWRGGRLVEAREALDETLRRADRVLGPEHPDTLRTRGSLATALEELGDLAGARSLQEAILTAEERVLGPEHPNTVRTRGNLATTLVELGDLAGARSLQEAVLTAEERVLGPEHPNTLRTRGRLAVALKELGDLVGARAHFEAVLAAEERLLGPEHPRTLMTRGNLAVALHQLGDHAGERASFEAVLAGQERVLGPEHPHTLMTRGNLAVALRQLGDHAGARTRYEAVLAAMERALGPEHPDTLRTRGNLANTLRTLGDLRLAWALYELNQPLLIRCLGPEHPWTLAFGVERAVALRALGELTRAREIIEQLNATAERVLGGFHPHTLTARHELALTLFALGDLPAALDHLTAVLAARQSALPAHHHDRTRAAHDLYRIHRELGETDAADTLYEAELRWLVELDEEPQAWVQREIRNQLLGERAEVG